MFKAVSGNILTDPSIYSYLFVIVAIAWFLLIVLTILIDNGQSLIIATSPSSIGSALSLRVQRTFIMMIPNPLMGQLEESSTLWRSPDSPLTLLTSSSSEKPDGQS